MQAYTHFRCVFDVSPAEAIPKAWLALLGEVRAWIRGKESAGEISGWFFNGGSWQGKPPGRSRIVVRSLGDGGGPPEMWAVRYEHADRDTPIRRWITDVGVAEVGSAEWRVAVEVRHQLKPGYVGPEPPAPQPSSPNIVLQLMAEKRWVCRAGKLRLTPMPVALPVGKGHQFVDVLKDPMRVVPVVLVSCERKTGQPKLDPAALARALAGTAVVYACQTPECDDEFEFLMPLRFRSGNGTVRIYAPGVDFDDEWTSQRHRFFHPQAIDEQGAAEVTGQIVRALTRSDGWRGLRSSVSSVDDIDARVRERRLGELRASQHGSVKEKDELIKLFEQEVETLEETVKEREVSLQTLTEERDTLSDRLSRQEYELDEARTQASELREAAKRQHEAVEAVTDLKSWPDTPVEIARLAGRLFAGRILMTAQALRSLEKSEFVEGSDASDVLWRCLRAMATDLYPLVLDQDPPAANAADHFKSRTGFELTWTEGKETKKDNRLMAARRLKYDGQDVDITPHLKWGNRPPKCLRVHFYVDRRKRLLVIGHCGDHMDTYGTRRRAR
jgi:hypothetical protein